MILAPDLTIKMIFSKKVFWHCEIPIPTVLTMSRQFLLFTFLRQAFPNNCRNSFVFSGSWPATTFDGLTLKASPVTRTKN